MSAITGPNPGISAGLSLVPVRVAMSTRMSTTALDPVSFNSTPLRRSRKTSARIWSVVRGSSECFKPLAILLSDDNQRVAAIYPRGEVAVVEGAGHNLAYENTAFTIDLIRDFITRK
jgi:pimeloyl-ACP methyl ester carboxylesterase